MSVNVMGDAEPSDTFQKALLRCEGGTVQGLHVEKQMVSAILKTCSVQ
jgi:hypothetical protein